MPSMPSPRDAQRIGQWTAFRKWADRDAVMFTPQAVWARDFLKDTQGSAEGRSAGGPRDSFVSCDGRTAVNTRSLDHGDGESVTATSRPSGSASSGELALGL